MELLTRLKYLKCRATQISELKIEIRGGGRSREYYQPSGDTVWSRAHKDGRLE